MTLRSLLRVAATVAVVTAVITVVRLMLPPAVAEGYDPPSPDRDIFDPRTQRGLELPAGYRPSVGRDVIRPIYHPQSVPGDAVDWPDDTLVMGVAIDGEAKAYPVNVLNFREMVIDRLHGIPLLVSW
jgi:hypothetical protein